MNSRLIWKILLSLTVLAGLWLSSIFIWKFASYHVYRFYVPLTAFYCEVVEIQPSVFTIDARCVYPVKKQNYEITRRLEHLRFSNRYTALEAADILEKQYHGIWHAKNHPEKITLERKFPYKALFRLVISFGVIVYFLWLREYVRRYATI